MKAHTLQGSTRDITGRKVKTLRKAGSVPATIYGKKITSESISVSLPAFQKVYASAGETGLIELTVDKTAHPVLIHTVQTDPVDGRILHVEFYQVDLKVNVRTKVPLELVGQSPAVEEKKGVLLSLLTEVEVEALPAELPEKIDVDVSGLLDVDHEIKVSQLKTPPGVTILTDQEVGVVKVDALVSKEAEAQAAEEEAKAAEGAEAETSAKEGAVEEGKEKSDEKQADTTSEKPDNTTKT